MEKFLSLFLMGSLALTASAASRVLLSASTDENGYKYVTTFEYDTENRLTKVTSGETVCTFDYSQLAAKKFVMTRTDTYEWQTETIVTEMTLNDAGLVVKAVEIENGQADEDYFTFDYTDGYLTNFKQVSPDEVEETKITYTNGIITKVENIDGESVTENDTSTFDYDGIPNSGDLMIYDTLFNVDLDDFELVAMTGMLGKAPAELPVKSTQTDSYGSESATFAWTLDEAGYPTKIVITEDWGSETIEFTWSGSAGIATVGGDDNGESTFFTIDGVRASSDTKGILIMRRADGSSVKVVRR